MALTVTQLNEYVRRSLAADPMLRGVYVTGEISNFKRHASGHWYFTLKDEDAAVNCAMFRQSAITVRFRPENGQRVRVLGSVGLYTKTGSYQLYADAMEPEGIGDLYLQFEALKRKLSSEGLFDVSLKKPLPLFPKGVGIVTSRTGAVVHDISRVAWRRFPGINLFLCPVKVQGSGAAREIADALLMMDAMPEVEVIIVGRGGGSMEDLWPFNEECVARAIARCQTPVISAVGHETDFTIADFVADVRAATPSVAAELAVPEVNTLHGAVELVRERMDAAFTRQIDSRRLALTLLQNRLAEASPAQKKERMLAELSALKIRLHSAAERALAVRRIRLEQAGVKLEPCALAVMSTWRKRLENAELLLRASGPMETMKRGYAIVTKDGRLIRSANEVFAGERVDVKMYDGNLSMIVDEHQRG